MDGITDLMDMNLSKLLGDDEVQRSLGCCNPWGHTESELDLATTTKSRNIDSSVFTSQRKQYQRKIQLKMILKNVFSLKENYLKLM